MYELNPIQRKVIAVAFLEKARRLADYAENYPDGGYSRGASESFQKDMKEILTLIDE